MNWLSLLTRRRAPLPAAVDRKLLITVGLPRSGKSTWARQQGHPVVNPDSIRLSLHGKPFLKRWEPLVWWLAEFMVDALFRAGHVCVIVDATNITMMQRARWTKGQWETVAVEFPIPIAECVRRAKESGKDYLIPVIQRMAEIYEPPSRKEPRIAMVTVP